MTPSARERWRNLVDPEEVQEEALKEEDLSLVEIEGEIEEEIEEDSENHSLALVLEDSEEIDLIDSIDLTETEGVQERMALEKIESVEKSSTMKEVPRVHFPNLA